MLAELPALKDPEAESTESLEALVESLIEVLVAEAALRASPEVLCPIESEVAETEVAEAEIEVLSKVVSLVVSLVIDSLTLVDAEMGTSAVESAVASVLAVISEAIGVIIIVPTFPLCVMSNYKRHQ